MPAVIYYAEDISVESIIRVGGTEFQVTHARKADGKMFLTVWDFGQLCHHVFTFRPDATIDVTFRPGIDTF